MDFSSSTVINSFLLNTPLEILGLRYPLVLQTGECGIGPPLLIGEHLRIEQSSVTGNAQLSDGLEALDLSIKAVRGDATASNKNRCDAAPDFVLANDANGQMTRAERSPATKIVPNERNKFVCDVCQLEFSQRANMTRHKQRHSGVMAHKCPYCDRPFFRKDQMLEHSLKHLKRGMSMDCPVKDCSMQFPSNHGLKVHLTEEHSLSKNSDECCRECGAHFTTWRKLLLHFRTSHSHSGKEVQDDQEQILAPSTTHNGPEEQPPNGWLSQDPPESVPSELPMPKLERAVGNDCIINSSGFEEEAPEDDAVDEKFSYHLRSPTEIDYDTPRSEHSPPDDVGAVHNEEVKHAADHGIASGPSNDTENAEDPQRLTNIDEESGSNENDPQKHGPLPEAPDTEAHPSPQATDTSSSSPIADAIQVPLAQLQQLSECKHCGIFFRDPRLFFVHRGLHNSLIPWTCNLCGTFCYDAEEFHAHTVTERHV